MKRPSATPRKKAPAPARTDTRKSSRSTPPIPAEIFSVSVTKTIAAPVADVFAAWKETIIRARWLPVSGVTLRKATPHKSIRLVWPDGTLLSINFWPKGALKSQVVPMHDGLPDAATAEKMKSFWDDRLEALRTLLEKKV